MRSEDVIEILNDVIVKDLKSDNPTLNAVENGLITGGWEGWLQVALAKHVVKNGTGVSIREARYPNGQRCDLFFNATRGDGGTQVGVPIWIELKTQRSVAYADTAVDFIEDINKILVVGDLPATMPDGTLCRFKDVNVMLAVAIFVGYNGRTNRLLRDIGLQQGSKVKYYALNTMEEWQWDNVTDFITANEAYPLIAIFRI